MDRINKAIEKDELLQFLIDISPKDTDYREIKHKVLLNYNSEIIISIIKELINIDNLIIHKSIGDIDIISSNNRTKKFIDDGGFEGLVKQELINEKKIQKKKI